LCAARDSNPEPAD